MSIIDKHTIVSLGLGAGLLLGCNDQDIEEEPVDFQSDGAQVVRARACAQDWSAAARKGSAKEAYNASTLWSVSPYQVLVPTSGTGYVKLNVDAPHYDWLLYTTADTQLDNIDGPELVYNGPVTDCPELDLVEYGVHHSELTMWMLELQDTGASRIPFYAGLVATDHSDPNDAGHAGHDLGGDDNAPSHGGH